MSPMFGLNYFYIKKGRHKIARHDKEEGTR